MQQKAVPEPYRNVGRFWGHSSNVKPRVIASYRMTGETILDILDGWKYKPNAPDDLYRVLYNTAVLFTNDASGDVEHTNVDKNGQLDVYLQASTSQTKPIETNTEKE